MSGTVSFAYILMPKENSHFYDDGMMQYYNRMKRFIFNSEKHKISQEGLHPTIQCIYQYLFHCNISGL